MFRTQFNCTKENAEMFTCAGSKTRPVQELRIVDNVPTVVDVGVESVYDFIQSWKDSTDLKTMIARYESGDITALDKCKGIYADLTTMPETYAELVNRSLEAEQMFMKQPKDVRAVFDNNPIVFWDSIGDGSYVEKLKALQQPIPQVEPKKDGE